MESGAPTAGITSMDEATTDAASSILRVFSFPLLQFRCFFFFFFGTLRGTEKLTMTNMGKHTRRRKEDFVRGKIGLKEGKSKRKARE
jgi:hypothetical protein